MISNDYANKILNAMVGLSDSINRPSTVYLGLCKTEPNAATGAVADEPTAESYARQLVGGSSVSTNLFGRMIPKTGETDKYDIYNTAKEGIIENIEEIQMKTARQSWGEGEDKLNYWFLSESQAGNATIWGKIYDVDGNEGIEIPTATVPTFYEGQLQASIDVALN